MDIFCDDFINDEHNNVITGDMNIDVSKKTKNAKKYLSALHPHNLNQIIRDATRVNVNKKTSTIIDHILTNNSEINYVINKEDSVTDHFLIEIKFNNIKKPKEKSKSQKMTNCWKKYSKDKLLELMKNVKFNCDKNVNEKANMMMSNLREKVNSLGEKKQYLNKKINGLIQKLV